MSTVTYKEILELKHNLAPSQLNVLDIPNKNTRLFSDLLDRKLSFSDNGNEPGSINYINKSTHYLMRAKVLQSSYFLPFISPETTVPIRPQCFKNYNLQEGDLLISKDSNIGESVILDKMYPNYTMSGALYKIPISKYKLYVFAFLKHSYFKSQLDLFVPKGYTIRHAKTLFLNCKIPFPSQTNSDDIIFYVELLTQAILNKEKKIREKNQQIFDTIEYELVNNQKSGHAFKYEEPHFNEIVENLRIDAGYYCYDYKNKQFCISNYIHGAQSIDKWNFKIKRGQNLQVSNIGKSIYSNIYKDGFYTLVRPTSFSEFGTIEQFEYLGNSRGLSTLKTGDIVFSAEGTIGKCVLFTEPKDNLWITNIHGIILSKIDHNTQESGFVACFLRFLRFWGVLDYISVGGQGGSLAMKYWRDILIPIFPDNIQHQISKLYFHQTMYPSELNLQNFLAKDSIWNEESGILDIDKSIKSMKIHLNQVLDKIINNESVEINFCF